MITIYHCPVCGGSLCTGMEEGWLECLMCGRALKIREAQEQAKAVLKKAS